ncbi:MAG: type II toxin-antitoxin system RelE/ParE family toxin [Terracidiphilus sp.]|jgi:toxin ParE1/3/4
MKFRVSATARRDLDTIFEYWARRASPDIAGQLIYTITDRCALIAESPLMGRSCDEIAPGVLVFPAGKYLIYYRKSRGALHILQILHGARDQANAYARNELE